MGVRLRSPERCGLPRSSAGHVCGGLQQSMGGMAMAVNVRQGWHCHPHVCMGFAPCLMACVRRYGAMVSPLLGWRRQAAARKEEVVLQLPRAHLTVVSATEAKAALLAFCAQTWALRQPAALPSQVS